MKTKTAIATGVLSIGITAGLLYISAPSPKTATAGSCLVAESQLMFDTSADCSAQPSINRIFWSDVTNRGGIRYLAGNIGNEIWFWNIQNLQAPVALGGSHFRVGNVGDSDYDLMNFSICDDCRYGVANYLKGTVLFDMGTGSVPIFGGHTFDSNALHVYGAFTFKHGTKQYLIASDLANHCTDGNSTLYEFGGINAATDLINIGCVNTGLGYGTQIMGGFYVDGYLYLGNRSSAVNIFKINNTAPITLTYIDTPIFAFMTRGKGFAIDLEHMVVVEANLSGMSVWDISDPALPVKKSSVPGSFNRASVSWPFAFAAKNGLKQSERTFDITNLSVPVALDQEFWGADKTWNHASHLCSPVEGGTFSPDGSTLYLARYSRMQRIDFSGCLPDDKLIFTDGFEDGTTDAWEVGCAP